MGFDISQFINATYTEAFQVTRTLVEPGDYVAYIQGFDVQVGTRAGTLFARLQFIIDDPELAKVQNREKVILNHMLFLDCDETDPNILLYGVNQNVELGRIRAALGQNNPAEAWNFSQLEGAGPILIHVEHRQKLDKLTKQPVGDAFENITRYARMAA